MGACLARAVDWRDGGFCSCFQATAESGKKSFPDLVQLLGFHPPIFLAMKFRRLWKRKSPRSLGDENVMTMVVKALHRCDDPSSELAAGIFFHLFVARDPCVSMQIHRIALGHLADLLQVVDASSQ